jgi:hypothetical protein
MIRAVWTISLRLPVGLTLNDLILHSKGIDGGRTR